MWETQLTEYIRDSFCWLKQLDKIAAPKSSMDTTPQQKKG